MQVVIERAAFAQKLRREDQIVAVELSSGFAGVADRDGGLDDHHRARIDGQHVFDHCFDRAGVEVVGLGIVVGRGGDDDVIGAGVSLLLIQRGLEIERAMGEIVFDLDIFDRRLFAVQHRHFFGQDIERHHLIVLGEQNGIGESDVAGSGDGDFHGDISEFASGLTRVLFKFGYFTGFW